MARRQSIADVIASGKAPLVKTTRDQVTQEIASAASGKKRKQFELAAALAARGMNSGGRPVLTDNMPWSPLLLPGLVGWYDASLIRGLNAGALVDSIEDHSGSGNHMLAFVGNSGIYQISVANGLPGVLLDGSDDCYLAASLLPPAGPRVTVLAYVPTEVGEFTGWGRNTAANGSYGLGIDNCGGFSDTGVAFNKENFAPTLDVPHVLTLWMTASDAFFRVDGVQIGTAIGDTVNIVGTGFWIGTGDSARPRTSGYFLEEFHCDADLSSTQLITAEYHLMEKWGVGT